MQNSTKNRNVMDCPIKVKLMFTPITPVVESFRLLVEIFQKKFRKFL